MLHTSFFTLAAALLVPALAIQVPLGSTEQKQHPAALTTDGDLTEWSFNKLPDLNATDHFVFETVHSLLQQWPNTRMRNGHTIVPGIIPNGTLLYHGRSDMEIPTGPEWAAVDPEHSYLLCRDIIDPSQRGGWHLTLIATRPLKVVYFDGSSAVKIPFGSMDTQDLFSLGTPSACYDVEQEEMDRVQYLCKWGKNFGVDGFVRMEMDFEVVLCDFRSGLSVVSFEHLASEWSGSLAISSTELFEVIHSGAWHNRFPGETRIQLDLPGMVSFYDTQLAPSLVPVRAGQERWDHRPINISNEDFAAVKSRLETNLIRPGGVASGIDWKTLVQVIVDRYAGRFELTRYLLNVPVISPDKYLDSSSKVQTQLRIMLTPYLLFSAKPTDPLDAADLDWTVPIYKLCATAHTHSMESRFGSMTDSEKLLLQAVRGTSREICRVVTKMWAAGVYAGIDPLLNMKDSPNIAEVARLRDAWAEDLEGLMAWLDWSVWIKCDPSCGAEEMCYLPTWPVGFPSWSKYPMPSPVDGDYASSLEMPNLTLQATAKKVLVDGVENTIRPEPNEWIRPQPRCIRRVEPYTY